METTAAAPQGTPTSLDQNPRSQPSTTTTEEPMNNAGPTNDAPTSGSGDAQTEEKGKDEEGNDKEKPATLTTTKKKENEIDLPITSRIPGASRKELERFIELENEMISQDKKEKERLDGKNALEEYVYEMREKLNGDEFGNYADDNVRQELLKDLQTTVDWLYNEGAYQETTIYVERLKSLRANKY